MAEKRMFSKKIIDTDWFMDMPASSQCLYFHLSMRADDDGFIANPKRIIKLVGASDDDYKLLIAKRFIIVFESGICVITDWRINNYLRGDRYTETTYQDEMKLLTVDEKGKYNLGIPSGIPLVSTEYSVSNSNNNSLYYIGDNDKKDYDFTDNIKDKIKEWLEYKKENGQRYKPKGLEVLLRRLEREYKEKGEQYVIDEIEYSMSNRYAGIYAKKYKPKGETFVDEEKEKKKQEIINSFKEKEKRDNESEISQTDTRCIFARDVINKLENKELRDVLIGLLIMRNGIRKPIIMANRMQEFLENLRKKTQDEQEQIKIVQDLIDKKSDRESFV